MPKYKITYVPTTAVARSGLENEIEADHYRTVSRFIDFYRNGEVILRVAAAQVLQVKVVE